jgi:hypothetical protein
MQIFYINTLCIVKQINNATIYGMDSNPEGIQKAYLTHEESWSR